MTPPPRLAATSSRGSGAIWARKRWTTIRRRRRYGWDCENPGNGKRETGNVTREAFICAALRTPVGKHGGSLAGGRAHGPGSISLKAGVGGRGDGPPAVRGVILRCTQQAGGRQRHRGRVGPRSGRA